MTNPLVSIIVPVYNQEKYLSICLDSLINQSLSEIEIICVNDCSTDKSLNILNEYSAKDSRVIVINLPKNVKQGGARNAGIQVAKASFLGFVDSDDWVSLDMYEKLYNRAIKDNADIVCSNYYQYFNEATICLQENCDSNILAKSQDEINKYFIMNGLRLWTNIIKRKIFSDNDLMFPEEIFYEDNAIGSIVYLSSKKVVKEESAYYYYRCDNVSTTRSQNNYRFYDRLVTSKLFLTNMKERGYYDRYKLEIDFRFTELFFINSIFGSFSRFDSPEKIYISKIIEDMKLILPDFKNNKYYKSKISFSKRLFLSIVSFNINVSVYIFNLTKCLVLSNEKK